MSGRPPQVGEPAPWFEARAPINPRFHFDTIAGRKVVMCFFGSAGHPAGRRVLDDFLARRDLFDDVECSFFGVSVDPQDEEQGRIAERHPGIHLFWDFDRRVSRMYGAVALDVAEQAYRPMTYILDERLRVMSIIKLLDRPEDHVERVFSVLRQLPVLPPPQPAGPTAPVLVAPYLFEPELCKALIRCYEEGGGEESGFMREVGGKTVAMHDYGHKRRRDQTITDEDLIRACTVRIHNRLAPEIHKAFQFRATRIERYLVACYDSTTGGHFRAHRDNTTKGTAHRRFAVSLNLNSDYEGGLLRFPEFGRQLYQPPAGGAVVFSCSLLHEATPVTAGVRYVFLPFLYDEEGARIRQENLKFLGAHAP